MYHEYHIEVIKPSVSKTNAWGSINLYAKNRQEALFNAGKSYGNRDVEFLSIVRVGSKGFVKRALDELNDIRGNL